MTGLVLDAQSCFGVVGLIIVLSVLCGSTRPKQGERGRLATHRRFSSNISTMVSGSFDDRFKRLSLAKAMTTTAEVVKARF